MVFKSKPSNRIFSNTYIGNWEADLLEVTPSGYQYEYEVKLSKSDFLNDAKKEKKYYNKLKLVKHDVLQQGKRVNYFYFIVPRGLIKSSEVPEWAGLIYFDRHIVYDVFEQPSYISTSFTTIKVAMKLSTEKITDKKLIKLYESTYFKYHRNSKTNNRL